MKPIRTLLLAALALLLPCAPGLAALTATFTSATGVGVTSNGYTASGTATLTLGYAPTPTDLMVVKNTGAAFISGTFSNLAQGQTVSLSYGGVAYDFVVNYYGGTGNDLVLVWKSDRALAWGYNGYGQLGNQSFTDSSVPVAVEATSVLSVLTGKTVVSLAAGYRHSVALCSDGTVAAWGRNDYGQLGINATNPAIYVPVAVTTTGVLAGKTVVAVAAGYQHSVALCSDGTVAAWGYNTYGQLGNNSTTDTLVPVAVTATGALAGKTVVAVAAGGSHSVALCSDGTVAAWGLNSNGQLGSNSPTQTVVPVAVTATGVLAGKTVVAVAAGSAHSVALCSDGTVAAWGLNTYGQLGNNSTTQSTVPVAVTATGMLAGKTVVAVAAGYQHSVALCSDGTVAAWGYNIAGQLGNNSTTQSSVPVAVNTSALTAGERFSKLFSGQFALHTLALASAPPQIGSLTAIYTSATDVPVTSASPTLSGGTATLTLGYAPTPGTDLMVVKNTGAAFISGTFSNLAQGQTVSLSYGGVAYDFVVNYYGGTGNDLVLVWKGNRALAWGPNGIGQLGNNSTTQSTVPVAVTATGVLAGKTVLAVAAGYIHSVALCSDGTVAAWGYNAEGQLGNNSTTNSSVPVAVDATGVLAGKTVVAVAAGSAHSVALCSDGTVAAWGYNAYGMLGNNSTTDSSVPVAVTATGVLAGKTVVAVAAGSAHSVALCSDGTVAAWGLNSIGQLGNNSTTQSTVPVAVTATGVLAGKTVVAVAAGDSHNVALCSDGTVAAWGYNSYGQLGNNSTTNSSVPVAVTATGVLAGKTVVAIAVGAAHSVALCSNGTVAAWGRNPDGQLGNNSTTQSTVPVAVTATGVLAGKTVVAVAAGSAHSVALCSDGTVAAWGNNAEGQLGNNSTTNSSVPVAVNTSALTAGERFCKLFTGPLALHTLALRTGSPEIEVQQPAGTSVASGGSKGFGNVNVGATSDLTFTIANLGYANLALSGTPKVAVSGSSDFSVTAQPTSPVAANGTTTFTVRFAPTSTGSKTATLTMANNDSDEGTYTVTVNGTGVNTPPVVTLLGANPLTFEAAASYTDSGATATDAEDGTLTPTITSNTVVPNVPGTYGVTWRATDSGSLTSTVTRTVNVVDTAAPETTITSSPSGTTASTGASIAFMGGDVVGVARFEGSLDGGAYATVTSPVSLSGLADGPHTFAVRAVDAAGNTDATPASVTWTVDTTAPVISGTPANITTPATSVDGAVVSYAAASATDNVTGSPTIEYSKASGSVFPLGVTTVTISATDAVGNVGTSSFTVTVNGVPGVLSFANATPSFNPVDSAAVATVVSVQINRAGVGNGIVSVNVAPSQPATVPSGFAKYVYGTDYEFVSGNASGSTVSFADGVTSATVEVRLKTPALTKKGQFKLTLGTPTGGATTGTPAVALVTINARDAVKPTVVIATPAATVDAPGTFNLTGTVKDDGASGLSLFTVTLNGRPVTPIRGAYLENTAVPYSATGLQAENGTNTLVVTARDAQGNTTVMTRTFTCAGGSLSPALAGTYTGLLVASGMPDNDSSGFFTATITPTASFTGNVTLGGITVPIKGLLNNDGVAKFTANAFATDLDLIDDDEFDTYLGSLVFTIPTTGGDITATVSTQPDAGSTIATATAAKNAFDTTHPVAAAHSNLLTALTGTPKGVYNVSLPSETQLVLTSSQFPQGDGVGILTLLNTGSITLKGNLADGTAYTASGNLKADLTAPLHVNLYKKQGALAGTFQFDPGATNSDVSGANFLWLRPAQPRARAYKAGWPNGVTVNPVGTKFIAPMVGSVLPRLHAINLTLGNAKLDFTDGLLSPEVHKSLNITQTPANTDTPLGGDTSYTLMIVNSTGGFSGSFTHTSGKSVAYKGIILNKGGNQGGFGYFLSPPPRSTAVGAQGGSVTLQAKP